MTTYPSYHSGQGLHQPHQDQEVGLRHPSQGFLPVCTSQTTLQPDPNYAGVCSRRFWMACLAIGSTVVWAFFNGCRTASTTPHYYQSIVGVLQTRGWLGNGFNHGRQQPSLENMGNGHGGNLIPGADLWGLSSTHPQVRHVGDGGGWRWGLSTENMHGQNRKEDSAKWRQPPVPTRLRDRNIEVDKIGKWGIDPSATFADGRRTKDGQEGWGAVSSVSYTDGRKLTAVDVRGREPLSETHAHGRNMEDEEEEWENDRSTQQANGRALIGYSAQRQASSFVTRTRGPYKENYTKEAWGGQSTTYVHGRSMVDNEEEPELSETRSRAMNDEPGQEELGSSALHSRGRSMEENVEGKEGTSSSSSRGRVAVCFFGLGRSLRWTVPSVKRRVLHVLRDSGFEVDIFVHTYSLNEVNNERAGEEGIQYALFRDDFRVLNLTRGLMTNQDDLDLVVPDPISLTRYHWVYQAKLVHGIIRNVFRAYWSLATVSSLMLEYAMETGTTYDAVVLARPDVWFHADIDLPMRAFPLPTTTVFMPSFDTEEDPGTHKNDRFAYGSMTAMNVYMNRLSTFTDPEGSRYTERHLNSEWVLGHHLKLNNISVETFDLSVTRVRLTGVIPQMDYERVLAACQSGADPMACKMVHLGYKFPTIRNSGSTINAMSPDNTPERVPEGDMSRN